MTFLRDPAKRGKQEGMCGTGRGKSIKNAAGDDRRNSKS
jgi:hypothetical protein